MTAPHATEPFIGGGLVGREEAGFTPPAGPASSSLSMLADAIEEFVRAFRAQGELLHRLMASAPAGDQDSRPGRDETR